MYIYIKENETKLSHRLRCDKLTVDITGFWKIQGNSSNY